MTLTERPPTEEQSATTKPPRGSYMPQIVGGGVLVFIGALWLLERIGTVDISVTAVLALATMVIGISLMLLAKEGSHVGLIVFGTILGLVTLLTAAAPFEGFQGGVGDRTIQVSSVDAIRADYNLAMGTMTIDLREVDDVTDTAQVTASVGMGELVIRVPRGADFSVDAEVGAGEIEILGRTINGVGLDEAYETPGFEASNEGFVLNLQAFTGRVEVTDG